MAAEILLPETFTTFKMLPALLFTIINFPSLLVKYILFQVQKPVGLFGFFFYLYNFYINR